MVESQEAPYVLVIGDINVDILASAEETLAEGETLHGRVESSLGGVGRNVAWNLRKLGIPVIFLTTAGKDVYGQKALEEAEALGVDLTHAKVLDDETSSAIFYLEDKAGDVFLGLKDIHSLNYISTGYLKEKADLIRNAALCLVSGNLPKESLAYLADNHKETPIVFDPASNEMAKKTAEIINGFHTVTPNQEEMETLSGTTIESFEDAKKAGEKLRKEGSQQIVLTLDDGGAVYNDETDWKLIESPAIDPVSTTGAGDAFNAGLLYGFYHQFELEDSVKFGIAASTLTLQAKEAVHPELSVKRVEQMMDEINYRKK